jgi:hypothetical protein
MLPIFFLLFFKFFFPHVLNSENTTVNLRNTSALRKTSEKLMTAMEKGE